MYEIDNKRFGVFLAQLRKQKGLTQKELAKKLFLSDKAVSKWERGLSMPDIALLFPLADLLGVTVTELLSGQHIRKPGQMDVGEVERLVNGTVRLSAEKAPRRKRLGAAYFACVLAVCLELAALFALGYTGAQLKENLLVVELLSLFFGGWFCLFAKETLPAYYDENEIHAYNDGIFRMNLPGVSFNNRNWPRILRVGRIWMPLVSVLFPLLYLAVSRLAPAAWDAGRRYFQLAACVGFFVPMMAAAKRSG